MTAWVDKFDCRNYIVCTRCDKHMELSERREPIYNEKMDEGS